MNVWACAAGIAAFVVATGAAAQQPFSGDLCGNKANVTIKPAPAGTDPKLVAFLGVWSGGKWESGTCNALVVSEINGGKATVTYYFGRGVDVPTPGSFTKTDAAMSGKYLKFISLRGSTVMYEPASGGMIKGWFDSLQTVTNLKRAQ
jgi:hypothetical protein